MRSGAPDDRTIEPTRAHVPTPRPDGSQTPLLGHRLVTLLGKIWQNIGGPATKSYSQLFTRRRHFSLAPVAPSTFFGGAFMIGHDEILARLLDPGLLPVIRTDTAADVMPVCEALVAGGVTALEITLTVPNALECIGEAAKHFAPDVITGAGSVTTPEMCRAAIDAGAVFIVTPIMRPEIARVAKAAGCAVVLGAFTPTEAQSAYEAGADLVKIFPADNPSFIKALRAPLRPPQLA